MVTVIQRSKKGHSENNKNHEKPDSLAVKLNVVNTIIFPMPSYSYET